MQLRVRSITYLAEAINGYELVDPRGRDLPRFEAGAHVDLRIGGFLRQYSLWNDPAERRRSVSGAKAYIGQAARWVGQQAVQMHGAMGVVDDLIVSHYFKRLTMIDLMFGNQQHHLTRYSNLAMAA